MSPSAVGHLRQLQELSINCSTWSPRVYESWILDFLGHLPSPSKIKSIRLRNLYYDFAEAESEAEFWQRVDTILSSYERYPALAALEFGVEFDPWELEEGDAETRKLNLAKVIRRMFFPKLYAAHRLSDARTWNDEDAHSTFQVY